MRRLAAVAAVIATYGVTRLVFNLVGLRVLGAEAVGIVNLTLSFSVLISLPASAGVAPALSRFLPLAGRERPRTVQAHMHWWGLGTSALSVVPLGLLFLLGYRVFSSQAHGPRFAFWVLLWAGLYSLYALSRAELFALDRTGKALALEGCAFALFAASLLVLRTSPRLSWLPFTAYYLPAAAFALLILGRERESDPVSGAGSAGSAGGASGAGGTARGAEQLAGAAMAAPGSLRPLVAVPFREMRRFALFALLGSVASLGVSYLSTIVVSAASGVASAGLWATLMSVAAPLLLAPRTLSSSFSPRLSFLGQAHPDLFRKLSLVHQRFSSLLAVSIVGCALIFARPALGALVARGEANDALVLTWRMICVASFGLFRGEPVVSAAAALGLAARTAAAAFAGAGLCIALWVALLPAGGLPAVAAGYMVFALTTPVFAAAAARLRFASVRSLPSAPFALFASDGLFALIAVLSFADLLEGAAMRAATLAGLLLAFIHGALIVRRESLAIPEAFHGPGAHEPDALATQDPGC